MSFAEVFKLLRFPRMFPFVVVLPLLLVTGLAHGNDRSPISTTDLLRLRMVQDVKVCQTGDFLVWSLRSIAANGDIQRSPRVGDYENHSHLWMLRLDEPDATPRQITFGKRRDRSPVISPDGRQIAFLRSGVEGGSEKSTASQVWLMPLDGGEARQLTNFQYGASAAHFSPDGLRLVTSSQMSLKDIITQDGVPEFANARPGLDWSSPEDERARERAGLEGRPGGSLEEIRAWLEENAALRDPKVIDRLAFQGEHSVEEGHRFRQVFVIKIAEEEPVRITRGTRDHFDPQFTADGGAVLYAMKGGTAHPEEVLDSSLMVQSLDGGEPQTLFARDGWALSRPQPFRDGSLIAFLGRRTDEPAYRSRRIGLVSSNGGEPIWATGEVDLSVQRFGWRTSRPELLFTAAQEGGVPLFSASPATLEPSEMVDQRVGLPVSVGAFDAGGGNIAWNESSAANPSVLRGMINGEQRILFDPNPWIVEREISRPLAGWVVRPDGTKIQYWYMPPTRKNSEERSPLLLQIHGGPATMWGPGKASMWLEWQLFCSWGYAVVYGNPRGSSGYGEAFQRGNYQNWGPGPAGDCLAIMDTVLEKHDVDPDRLAVTGGSYGGFLTAWIIAHDNRFKAAVAQRGVYELGTFFGEGNAWRLVEWSFGGQPFDPRFREVMNRNSPFLDVRRIRTPLLIMHAENDLRTGVSQSAMLYRALRVLDRPVEYVLYPRAGHDLSRTGDPVQRMDRLDRMIEFFSRFVDPGQPAPVGRPLSSDLDT